MEKLPVMVLSIVLLTRVSGGGLCQENASGPSYGAPEPVPEMAKGSCRTIAGILSIYPVLEVRASEEPIRGGLDGKVRYGCRVHASGPARGLAGEVPPDQPIRFLLGEDGWEEDLRHAADGPGTTSFALRKEGILCLFSGGAHSWIEDGKVESSETFEFEAGCAAEAEPGEAAPNR